MAIYIEVRLADQLSQQLEAFSARHGMSRDTVIALATRQYMGREGECLKRPRPHWSPEHQAPKST